MSAIKDCNASYPVGGGLCQFPLPTGPTSAARARELLASTMRALRLPEELVDDGALAVSELATNARLHAAPARGAADPYPDAELWIWARTLPRPQLVVSVFDTDRSTMPCRGPADLLDEHGKGLSVVELVAERWGAHPSRSRLASAPRPGKRVWFALALPHPWPWPWTMRVVSSSLAAKRLLDLLKARGVEAKRVCHDEGVALISAGRLNIWVEPRSFAWCDGDGGYVRHPHLDLQEAVESVIAALDGGMPQRRRPWTP